LLSVYLEISKWGSPPNTFPTYQMALQAYTLLLSRLPLGHIERAQGNEMFKVWEGLAAPEISRYVGELRAWLQQKYSAAEDSDNTTTTERRSPPPPSFATASPDCW